jgi:Ca2+-binding RTX toxin-like protein
VFDTKPNRLTNVDKVIDFKPVDDTFGINNAVFTKVGSNGRLTADAFFKDKAAADAEDRVIYDPTTGNLFYDADGKGGAVAIKFAVLTNKAALTVADFVVI